MVLISPGSAGALQGGELKPPIAVLDKIEDRGEDVGGQRPVRLLDFIRKPSEYFGLLDRS